MTESAATSGMRQQVKNVTEKVVNGAMSNEKKPKSRRRVTFAEEKVEGRHTFS